MKHYSIAEIGGDGIGPEVTAQAMRVLNLAADMFGFKVERHALPFGSEHYLATKEIFPDAAFEEVKGMNAIFLGAIGDPRLPVGLIEYGIIAKCRFDLDLFANVRPIQLYDERLCPLKGKGPEDVDMVIVRENTEDLYCGIGGRLNRAGATDVTVDSRVITRKGCERVIRKAFEIARRRNGAPGDGKRRVTCIAKDNVLDGCRFFVEVFHEIGAEYPDIEKDTAIVDAFTQWLVQKPEWYDVCVTTNMFGDIVTDLASVLQGGMGLAVGANIGERHAMFEPIHGSAPKHAGKDRANPIAMILSVKEALAWLGDTRGDAELIRAADVIEACVVATLEAGAPLTYDMVGEAAAAPTSAVGTHIAAAVKAALQ